MSLKKGESIKFLDYTIKNCLNNDGVVVLKEGVYNYQCHLGNYGPGDEESIDSAKMHCILYFMIARPEVFANTICNRAMGGNGLFQEYYLFRSAVKNAGLPMPEEITCGGDLNCQVCYKDKKIIYKNHKS